MRGAAAGERRVGCVGDAIEIRITPYGRCCAGWAGAVLLPAVDVAQSLTLKAAANGIRYALFGDVTGNLGTTAADLARFVQAVPATVAPALAARAFYFVPLAMAATRGATAPSEVLIAPAYTTELAEGAICHRTADVPAAGEQAEHGGIFVSARLLRDQFGLAFELFINVAHVFVDIAGLPGAFAALAWKQATSEVRGETSQDAWEFRAGGAGGRQGQRGRRAKRTGCR